MSSDRKLITIFGGTGKQGGSVAHSLLQNPDFRVRVITRNAESDASLKLAALGAEIAQGNGFTSDDMLSAFSGSWGAFVNINSDDKVFATEDGPTEFDMGKIIVDSAVAAGVKHLVFSSGPPCTEMTNGRVRMKAMDMKNKIENYAKTLESFETFTPIGAGWFLENFLGKEVAPMFGGFPHFTDDDGYLTFKVPYWGGDEHVPWLSISDDFGDIVHGIFLDPGRWNGHFVHGVSDIRSFEQIVADFTAVTGHKARFQPILPTWEAFDTHGIQELEDVKLMFGFTQLTGGRYFGLEDTEVDTARQLKQITASKLGRPEEQHNLTSAREWFAARFAN
ncbi:nmrA-like family protein [Aspergillus bombycis]|uniref:NmrA-like family protein n=1 Tax=Aspergillus bombycis TaxID=109264 RepID=A0A1F8A9B1_9EURO|nr:nmrA-like family protein [Aspergillus bombycis]OGM47878.1 nmrA-like family protein [Aspergillus bombycis]